MVDSPAQYPASSDSRRQSPTERQRQAERIRGQDEPDPALSLGATVNENLSMPRDLMDESPTAEEAALHVTDDGLYAQEIEAVEHLGQDLDGSELAQASPALEPRSGGDASAMQPEPQAPSQLMMKERLDAWRGRARSEIQTRPMTYLLGAVGVGFILGKALQR